ncbi:hypothetical protein [Bremerella sp. P1]|uniref:hypothetical protein n=1 Tax=Bremerella sp. P1 TaxID=3026424 RepID=UPI002367D901|nr:hypothetical protein [Bremerella sp. P1]WDI40262.1 hypothetical protein PSR63_17415 [Bremerella sp. P1]
MTDSSELKIPAWLQAIVLIMMVACVPPIALILHAILWHLFDFPLFPFALLIGYLFLISVQFEATFFKSPRATKRAIYLLGAAAIMHAYLFLAAITFPGSMQRFRVVEQVLFYTSLVYLPATAILFIVMIKMNYVWFDRLWNAYGEEGPREIPPVMTLRNLLGAIAYLAMVLGFMTAIARFV